MDDPVSGGGWSEGEPARAEVPGGPRYERRQRLGKGGMGVVTVVWDRVLEREVALKEALAVDGSLLHEARLTALLDHPNIVPIYDASTADGRVTYTMRLLRGRPLDAALDAEGPGPERLRWLRAVLTACEAVAHAHTRGVVHRDLKPANLVVGELGEVQVVDWGLARRVGEVAPGHAGTPGYASPEQARGEAPARTDDVWALGRTLASVAGANDLPELRAIIQRATAPLPDRYPDARALAADLAGYIDGRRVAAYSYSPVEVLARLVRRHRLTVGVAGGVALLGVLAVAWQVVQTGRERDRAMVAEADARQELATSLGGRAAQALRDGMLPEAEVLAIHALTRGSSPEAVGVLAALGAGARATVVETHPLPPGCAASDLAAGTLLCLDADTLLAWDVGATQPRWTRTVADASLAASPDRVLVLDRTNNATLLRLADGAVVVDGTRPAARKLRAFADRIVVFGLAGTWTWQGDTVTAAPSPCPEGEILQDVGPGLAACDGGSLVVDGRVQRTPFTRAPAIPASVVRVGDTAWVGTFGGEVFAWSLTAQRVDWSTDVGVGAVTTLRTVGEDLLVVGSRGSRLLDAPTGSLIAALPAGVTPTEPQGDALWTLGETLKRWAVPTGEPRRELVAGVGLSGGAISPDGARIALAGGDGHLSVWSVPTGRRLGVVHDATQPLKPPIFLADGSTALAAGAYASPAGLRRLSRDGAVLPAIPLAMGVRRLAGLDAGFTVLSYGANGPERFDASGRSLGAPARHEAPMADVSVHPDHTEALVLDEADTLWTLDATHMEAVGSAPGARSVARAADLRAWASAHTLHVGREIDHPWSPVVDLALTPDGRRVVTGALDGTARIFDVASGALLAVFTGHGERITGVEVSPDGRWLLTTSWDHTARRWDLGALDAPVPPLPTTPLDAALQATAR